MSNIILYTTHSCPQCMVLKQLLKDKNISYKEETNLSILKSLKILSVPQLSVDGEIMNMKQAMKWLQEEC